MHRLTQKALSIVWGVKKVHVYLFGRSFTLFTDHQPLTSIFHPPKSIPIVTAARLQRYALFPARYEDTIEYRNTKVHSNADGLSHLPLEREIRNEEVVDPVGVFNLMQFDPLPVIETLQMLFARNGVPAQLVSDNGPQLKSEEFEQFLKKNRDQTYHFSALSPCHKWFSRTLC